MIMSTYGLFLNWKSPITTKIQKILEKSVPENCAILHVEVYATLRRIFEARNQMTVKQKDFARKYWIYQSILKYWIWVDISGK